MVSAESFQIIAGNGDHFQKPGEFFAGILTAYGTIDYPMLVGTGADFAFGAMTAPGPLTGDTAITGHGYSGNIRRVIFSAPPGSNFIQSCLIFGLGGQISLTFGAIQPTTSDHFFHFIPPESRYSYFSTYFLLFKSSYLPKTNFSLKDYK
jgi:hypothetical protein